MNIFFILGGSLPTKAFAPILLAFRGGGSTLSNIFSRYETLIITAAFFAGLCSYLAYDND